MKNPNTQIEKTIFDIENRLITLKQMKYMMSDKKNGFYFGGNDDEIKILTKFLHFLRRKNHEL